MNMINDFNKMFECLLKTLEGKDDYYFLVNDSNNEIPQHYDENYESAFDAEKFIESYLSKKIYIENNNMTYNLFVVPDKSVVLRNYLPFDTIRPRRNTNQIKDYIYDLNDILTEEDFFKNDTHINYMAALKIVPFILSKTTSKSPAEIHELLMTKLKIRYFNYPGDLFTDKNWSYPKDDRYEKNATLSVQRIDLTEDFEIIDGKEIPPEFRKVSNSFSEYYKNPNSLTDKKALIFRDSSTQKLLFTFLAYYREVFLYWDQWYFNKNLIDWFKADDVIEIRTERFLDNPLYPNYNNDFILRKKLMYNFDIFTLHDNKLTVRLFAKDVYNKSIDADADIYINDDFIKTATFKDGFLDFEYDLSDYPDDEYVIRFSVESNEIRKTDIEHQFHYCKDFFNEITKLNQSLKGRDNYYFLINDKDNELRQHYDKNYKSRYNLKNMKRYLSSKRKFFDNENISYAQFIIPDKSVVLREYLPIDTHPPKRHVNELKNYIYDLNDILDRKDYLINDTKISSKSSLKVVSYILHKTLKNKSQKDIHDEISKRTYLKSYMNNGDLFNDDSWSYSKNDDYLNYKHIEDVTINFRNPERIIKMEIPEKFKEFNSVQSEYYINIDPLSDKHALIICDKSIYPLANPLKTYFEEIFFYYDHGYLNKDLINYYNPDVVIEIKSEKTLETTVTTPISEEGNVLIPIKAYINDMNMTDDMLSFKLNCKDLCNLPVNTTCEVYLDDEYIIDGRISDGSFSLEHKFNNQSQELKIIIRQTGNTKSKIITKKL